MRGRVAVVAVVFGLAALAAGGASSLAGKRSTLRFKVVEAGASAVYTFYREDDEAVDTDVGRVSLRIKRTGGGQGRLTASGGRVRMSLKQRVAERVRLRWRSIEGDMEVTTCRQVSIVSGRGGLDFEARGSEVVVRWAFPQAHTRFCPGPKLDPTLIRPMKAVYPARKFKPSRVTLTLSGSSALDDVHLQAAYRWRAKVKLVRVD